jgi:hypothetical protein
MARASSLTSPVLVASVSAGPLVLASIMICGLYKTLPAPIEIELETVFGFGLALMMASVVGFLFALAITLVGTSIMIALGNRIEVARYRIIWLIVGALVAIAFCLIIDPNPEMSEFNIAIIASSAICAWLCRSSKPWEAL